jgi:hypothetical protein
LIITWATKTRRQHIANKAVCVGKRRRLQKLSPFFVQLLAVEMFHCKKQVQSSNANQKIGNI